MDSNSRLHNDARDVDNQSRQPPSSSGSSGEGNDGEMTSEYESSVNNSVPTDEIEYFGEDEWVENEQPIEENGHSEPAHGNDDDDNNDNDNDNENDNDNDNDSDSDSVRADHYQLAGLLGPSGIRLLHLHGLSRGDDDDDFDDDDFDSGGEGYLDGGQDGADDAGMMYNIGNDREIYYRLFIHTRSRKHKNADRTLPKVPSDEGAELMRQGVFGAEPHYTDRAKRRRTTLSNNLLWRGMGARGRGSESRAMTSFLGQDMLPTTTMDRVIHFGNRVYSGQFSDDGNFFFTTSQDFRARIYDTSNPHDWKYYRTTNHPEGSWTITDATLSPDNRFMAMSTIDNFVALSETDQESSGEPILLDFGKSARNAAHFGIWSLRFSGDGREIIAGTSASSVIAYDLETQEQTLLLRKHADDVNAVCYGDKLSPHILYSGSDDTTVRVWDRRSMSDGREAGCFLGHTEGVTYVDSKDDGRYVLSNGKDQSMKLWDLRKMHSTSRLDSLDPLAWSTRFDYRCDRFKEDDYIRHPHDCSVVTFRGHSVHKTLIRCHFSPPNSSNGRYVYTGSEDGKVWIYNLDATVAGTINIESLTEPATATKHVRVPAEDATTADENAEQEPLSAAVPQLLNGGSTEAPAPRRKPRQWRTCVRDASWHPDAPMIAVTAWAGYRASPMAWNGYGAASGTCTIHSWGADDEMGERDENEMFVDEHLEPIGVEGYRRKTGTFYFR